MVGNMANLAGTIKQPKGVTLIGMATAGKTTVGPILAKKLGFVLHDVDALMEKYEKDELRNVINTKGQDYILALEARTIAKRDLHGKVLVTPGSIVHVPACHAQLKRQTTVVWLDVPYKTIEARMAQDKDRAVIGLRQKGLRPLFEERYPLYQSLADIRIVSGDKTPETIADEIGTELQRLS